MERILLEPGGSSAEAAARAVAVLDRDGVVVMPAEGVYGLHIRPDRPRAMERLLALKPRAAERGWIGLVADPGALADYAGAVPSRIRSLVDEHWPGALTVVVPALPSAPSALRASDGTVALRCPGSELLRAVARACGGILLSTSANEPGSPAPARIEDVNLGEVDLVIDGGTLSGAPSTVVRVEGGVIRLLRPGSVRIEGL